MKPGLLDILRTGMALAGPVYSWIANPNQDSKRDMMDAIDAFRVREHEKALERIRKKYGGR